MADELKKTPKSIRIAGCILAVVCILLVVIFKGYENIPKGVNEVLFAWTAIGIFLLLRHRKDLKNRAYLHIGLIVIAFMIFWRMFFLNISSRYSFGLILPFAVIASGFLLDGLSKRRRPFVRFALFAAIVVSGIVLVWMNFNALTRNGHYDIMAEVFSGLDNSKAKEEQPVLPKQMENHVFTVEKEHFFHIGVIGGLDRAHMEAMGNDTTLDEYLAAYSRVYPNSFVIITSKGDNAEPAKNGYGISKIVSLCENPRKRKYRLIYSIVPDSANRCEPVSSSQIGPYPVNLLENGDFELADSGDESAAKFKLHVPEGAMTASDGFRTPRNAFFSANPPEKKKLDAMLEVRWDWVRNLINIPPQRLPECGLASDVDAIAGNSSARINAPGLPARLMFERQLPNGTYECSMLVRGSRGTEIAVLCDECRNGERKIVPVATAILTDKRLYRITARFDVEGLAEGESFQFGVEVAKGEAGIDDVTLQAVTRSAR